MLVVIFCLESSTIVLNIEKQFSVSKKRKKGDGEQEKDRDPYTNATGFNPMKGTQAEVVYRKEKFLQVCSPINFFSRMKMCFEVNSKLCALFAQKGDECTTDVSTPSVSFKKPMGYF